MKIEMVERKTHEKLVAQAAARAQAAEARAAKAEAVLGDLLQERGVAQELEALLAKLKSLVAKGLGKVGLEGAHLASLDLEQATQPQVLHGVVVGRTMVGPVSWTATLRGSGPTPVALRLMAEHRFSLAEVERLLGRLPVLRATTGGVTEWVRLESGDLMGRAAGQAGDIHPRFALPLRPPPPHPCGEPQPARPENHNSITTHTYE